MVLEATVICLDNSDWMRNGDYTPTRLEAQQDAINLICGAKTQSNPENTVGVLSGAGKSPTVLVSLTNDLGKVLSSIHDVKIGGTFDFLSSMQVAQLVLKHRQNKNQHQRVVVFVGSPICARAEELVRLGKRLKKNNIAIDIVNFGEEEENTEKLEAFISAIDNNEGSHLVTVPPGPHILSDILVSSPIVQGEEGGSSSGASSDFGGFGGVDPNLDPDLALALKVSMEEERARQEEARKRAENTGAEKSEASAPQSSTPESSTTQPSTEVEMTEAIDDDEFKQALALSMQMEKSSQSVPDSTSRAPTVSSPSEDVQMEDEDEQMFLAALQMSMGPSANPAPQVTSSSGEDINKELMEDPNFVNSILMSLPGVDPDDDRIKNALKQLEKKDKENK